ncbi:MAG: 2-C-methyl-D-erythritol 4-phosphate cytidylyltransferase [Cytophagales bacterium]|nr:MAG: 2-C-methyl-D-erythritol 4-phosphate cytidylyltransferase [Cytophagales bacterium]
MEILPPLYALIVAGGSGTRMKSTTPKQFMLVQEKPVLLHTLEKFQQLPQSIHTILVLPKEHINTWEKIAQQYRYTPQISIVEGGNTRTASVINGLKAIQDSEENSLVAIHDAVRPFISPELIWQSFQTAHQTGTALAVVASKDAIRYVDTQTAKNHQVDRKYYYLVQTPQTFRVDLIKDAYEKYTRNAFQPEVQDDASVAELAGHSITLIEGNYNNLKITTPEDITWANFLLQTEVKK